MRIKKKDFLFSRKNLVERHLGSWRRFTMLSAMLVAIAALFAAPSNQLWAFGEGQQAATGSSTSDYRLGALDKVRIKVTAWRPVTAEVFSWEALDGEYAISSGGMISIPLLGQIRASGSTTTELADLIAVRLQERIDLVEKPDTTVEVTEFRPIYVTGDVERPGSYAFRPGMNVIQALAIAGGYTRAANALDMRLEREIISSAGELQQLDADIITTLARKARLDAEHRGLDAITFDAALTSASDATTANIAMVQEKLIFSARREALSTKSKALEQLKHYLENEVLSLQGQLTRQDHQVELLNEELDGIEKLAAKGLVTAPRRLAIKRTISQAEADRLRLQSNLLRVKQEISRTDIALTEVRNEHVKDVTTQLAATTGMLEKLLLKKDTVENLIGETELVAARSGSSTIRGKKMQPVLFVLRQVDGSVSKFPVDETTIVRPDDTISVEFPTVDRTNDPLLANFGLRSNFSHLRGGISGLQPATTPKAPANAVAPKIPVNATFESTAPDARAVKPEPVKTAPQPQQDRQAPVIKPEPVVKNHDHDSAIETPSALPESIVDSTPEPVVEDTEEVAEADTSVPQRVARVAEHFTETAPEAIVSGGGDESRKAPSLTGVGIDELGGLQAAEADLSFGEHRKIQRALRGLQLYRGPIDGLIGPRTRDAIRQLQQRSGAAQTGYLTQQQLRLLIGETNAPSRVSAR